MSASGPIFEAPAAHGVRNPAGHGWGAGRQGPSGKLLPMARALAPLAARAVAGTLPPSGIPGGPDPIGELLAEAEQEAAGAWSNAGAQGGPAGLATADRMGAQASAAPNDVEAAAIVAGSLPITITVLGAVMPHTGADLVPFSLGGVGLLIAGVGLVLASRRRRCAQV